MFSINNKLDKSSYLQYIFYVCQWIIKNNFRRFNIHQYECFVNNKSKIIVQGITGKEGSFRTQQMIDYGTNIVAGVTPGKGEQTFR